MSNNKISFITDLLNRRVPQFVGIYLAASWGIIQFITWAVDRYLLSPYIVDLSFAISISMLPSILVLSYFHGTPGKDQWTKVEKIVIPVNFIVSLLVLIFVFYPKDLGAVTKDVTLIDQDGNSYLKTTVKPEFRKRYSIYLFNNDTNDLSNDWLSYGIGTLLRHDLHQDHYFTSLSSSASKIKADMGYNRNEYLSVAEMQIISERILSDYFITGNYDLSEEGMYVIDISVYKTSNAKKISEYNYKNNNLFSLIDEATLQIKHDLGIPLSYLDEVKDLPVSEVITSSVEALKNYAYAELSSEHIEKFKYYQEAVKYDPKSAYFHYNLALAYKFSADQENFKKHIDIALKYINKLSDKFKFALRMQVAQKDEFSLEKTSSILNMWIELFPHDLEPYRHFARFSAINGEVDKTLFYYNKILELFPDEHQYILKIGDEYASEFEYSKAEKYYLKYKSIYPKSPDSYLKMGRIHYDKNEYNKATEYFQQAKILGATGSEIDIFIGNTLSKIENWSTEKYAEYFMQRIDNYINEDGMNEGAVDIYNNIIEYFEKRGEYSKVIPYIDKSLEHVLKIQGEGLYYLKHIHYLNCYAELGRKQEADKLIVDIGEKLKNIAPFNVFFPTMTLQYYGIVEEWDKMNDMIDKLSPLVESYGINFLAIFLHDGRGDFYQKHKEYDKAIESYNKSLEISSAYTSNTLMELGKVYRKKRDYKMAEKMFIKAIKQIDSNAELYYEYVILKEEMGDLVESRVYIQKAYNLYKRADKEVKLAQKIWDKHKQLTMHQ